MSIDDGPLINVQYVYPEEHLPLRLIAEQALVHHVHHPHGVAAPGDAYQVEVVLPYLEVLAETRLELVHEDVLEAPLAHLVLLVCEVWRVHLALETFQVTQSRWWFGLVLRDGWVTGAGGQLGGGQAA